MDNSTFFSRSLEFPIPNNVKKSCVTRRHFGLLKVTFSPSLPFYPLFFKNKMKKIYPLKEFFFYQIWRTNYMDLTIGLCSFKKNVFSLVSLLSLYWNIHIHESHYRRKTLVFLHIWTWTYIFEYSSIFFQATIWPFSLDIMYVCILG